MSAVGKAADDEVDSGVDIEIASCLNIDRPKSFFLFAGAGSGKTGSLVKALNAVKATFRRRLQTRGQKLAVITYTNAARDEIIERAEHDPLVSVATIHSFVWSLIDGYNSDIREWLRAHITAEIAELNELLGKTKPGTKTALDRGKRVESFTRRLQGLDSVKRFTYSPDSDNRGRDALNHSEVLQIGAAFLESKPILRAILTNRFPILLIDESQDTNRVVMEALFSVQAACSTAFALGLFGDTMQRIYADGLVSLGKVIPAGWATPEKKMNHRCPKRIVTLINKIREDVDGKSQQARSDAVNGVARVFVCPAGTLDKDDMEKKIAEKMAEIAEDAAWAAGEIKTLILEHHMAAARMGFLPMFEALSKSDRLRIGMVDGSLPVLRWFSNVILPVVKASRDEDHFGLAAVVRKESPMLEKKVLKGLGEKQAAQMEKVRQALAGLNALWRSEKPTTFGDVLREIDSSGLFDVPDQLRPITSRTAVEQELAEKLGEILTEEERSTEISAYDAFLATSFDQIEGYDSYIRNVAQFGTHQGVKGLEFERVMVIADDDAARGFLFSYDKLFGVKEKTDQDLKNEREGRETGIDRTKRLFYVTCSRARQSLAIVCYSLNPTGVRDNLIDNGWFTAEEIEVLG